LTKWQAAGTTINSTVNTPATSILNGQSVFGSTLIGPGVN